MIKVLFKSLVLFLSAQSFLCANYTSGQAYISKHVPNGSISDNFKVPYGLERAVDFWIDVYSKHDVNHMVIHDTDFYVVYEVIDVSDVEDLEEFSEQLKSEIIDSRINVVRNKYRVALKNIHESITNGQKLDPSLVELYDKFKNIPDRDKFLDASRSGRMRVQKGHSSNFRKGLYYSQMYIGEMENIMIEMGLPMELSRLPYVESYFDPGAISHKSATGIWQFMKGTAAEYMKVSSTYDERKDPFFSTRAAATLLKQSYDYLWDSWPLAVTAYNHGRFGMKKASNKVGSRDLVEIIGKYNGLNFGFASKNFYAEFLAALFIDLNKQKFFNGIESVKPLNGRVVQLVKPLKISQIELLLGVDKEEIRIYNPAVSVLAFERDEVMPVGSRIRVPSHAVKRSLSKIENTRGVSSYVKVI